MIRFRSTVVNADKTSVTSSFGDDRRITPVGRFVRAYKIEELINAYDAANVESHPVWKPMHLQALYASGKRDGGEVAEDLFRRGICLPSSSSLSEEEQLYVINDVRRAARAGELLPQRLEEHSNSGTWSVASSQ